MVLLSGTLTDGERNKDKDKTNVCPHAEAHDNVCVMTSM